MLQGVWYVQLHETVTGLIYIVVAASLQLQWCFICLKYGDFFLDILTAVSVQSDLLEEK